MASSMEIEDCGTYSTVLVIGSVGWSNGVFHGFKFGVSAYLREWHESIELGHHCHLFRRLLEGFSESQDKNDHDSAVE